MKLIFLIEQGTLLSKQMDELILKGEAYVLLSQTQQEAMQVVWSQREELSYGSFIHQIFQICGLEYSKRQKKDPRIEHVLAYLHQVERVEDSFLEEVIDKLCLSKSRFLHLVKEECGVSFKSLLLTEKFLKTWHYLAEGENITDACIHGGFSDSAHFARYLKQSFGISAKKELQEVNRVVWVELLE